MASRYRNLIYSTAEYTHSYNSFRGVELNASSSTSSSGRLAYLENMYKDYDGDGADVIESIPGYRCFANYGEAVHALYYQRSHSGGEDHIIVHVADRLMRHPVSDIYAKKAEGVKIATLQNAKSFGFEYGRYFYVMDTQNIIQIDENGVCTILGDVGAQPYIPTTYVSGEEYEQRNLLTNDFKEEFYIGDPGTYLYSTKGLKFSVSDPYLRYCAVKGASGEVAGDIYIPAYVDIAGISYKVTSVDDYAFSDNTSITAVYIPDGVTEIGTHAFSGCTSLHTAVTGASVMHVGEYAFSGAQKLSVLYLGAGLTSVGSGVFIGCSSLSTVNYALDEEALGKVDGREAVTAKGVTYKSGYETVMITLPFHDKVESLTSVTVNGEEIEYKAMNNGVYFETVTLTLPSLADATGIRIVITGKLAPLDEDWSADMTTLSSATPYRALAGCRIAEVFDGRVFFSGNPEFPNTIFYTERARPNQNGLYVGRYNYFNDGIGSYKVKSLLAVRDMLAVFKEGEDSSGSIFYHKKEAGIGAIDTIYPVAYVHSGLSSVGMSLSFLDDPVFLTGKGLMALNNENINYQRNVACRSHNVNYALLKEDLSMANLCEWLGYLVVGVNGKIYLADSRKTFTHATGSREYEWFVIKDVGGYVGDTAVYRYSPDAYFDSLPHPTRVGEAADPSAVYSKSDADGVLYYYVTENGVKYRVVPTEELGGGRFCPATVFLSHENHLFFATEAGHLCVFNNDMRGIAPESVKSSEDYDESEYLALMGNKIHPLFYSFAGHTPRYVIRTALDDCGIPHLTKSTVKKSLVIKARSQTPGAIHCEVKTDSADPIYVGSLPISGSGFDSFDFSDVPWYVSRYASTSLREKEKGWIEKQIELTSDSFASPIAVWSISYRYVIRGKIKNNA